MNAGSIFSKPAPLDECRKEARALVEWLHDQADKYIKLAPALVKDIEHFREAATILDSYQAGLVLVQPHPVMRAELIRWQSVSPETLPPVRQCVLLYSRERDETLYGVVHTDIPAPPASLDPTARWDHEKAWVELDSGAMVDLAEFEAWALPPTGPKPLPDAMARALAAVRNDGEVQP